MKAIGIIPARYGSTRLPAKPLAEILGKTMVQRVYEIAQKAELLESVLVATDDERVAAAVRSFGGQAVLTNAGHASGTDRAAEAASSSDASIVVNIQGDEPLLDPRIIDECVGALRSAMQSGEGAGLATVVKRMKPEDYRNPSAVKAVVDLRGRALYFSRSPIPYLREGGGPATVYHHIGIYAYTRECLQQLSQLPRSPLEQAEMLEQLRALENGIPIQTVETQWAEGMISVDTEEDLDRVREALRSRNAETRR